MSGSVSEKLAVAEQPSPGIPAVQGRLRGRCQQSSQRRGPHQPGSAAEKCAAEEAGLGYHAILLLLLKSQKPMCGLFRKPSPIRPDLYWPTAGAARVR